MNLDFLGMGLRYPLRFEKMSGGTSISTSISKGYDHIRESIHQILNTRPGQRFMNPEFGSYVHELVFEQNDAILQGLLTHYIRDALEKWEKRIIIKDLTFDVPTDEMYVFVKISYTVIATQVDDNLVYPFLREIPSR